MKQKKGKNIQSKQTLLERVNTFFDCHEKGFVILSMVAGALMCLLLFDIKVSLSGDDSTYLVNAENFWRHFRYPTYHGPLYSIVVAPFIGIFGYQLVFLKLLSCIFMLTFLWLFYKGFRGKVASIILIPTLLLVSINSYVFFYASQTYSEALFMLTQGCFFFYLFKHFIDEKEKAIHLKSDWKKYVILGLLMLVLGLTRSIGYAAIGVLILLFAINRRWKDLIYSTAAFILVFSLFQLFKSIVWPESGASYDINSLLAKDYYNPVERESFGGLCQRFIENSQVYLSAFIYQFMGLIKEDSDNYIYVDIYRTILLYALFTLSLIVSLKKKNNSLLSIGLYAGTMCFASFVILHSFWGQDRLIMVFYPFILLFLLGGIYYLLQTTKLRQLSFVYLIIIGGLFIGTFSTTKNRIARNVPVLQQNILGDLLYGLTPDWQNFIKASQWAAENLDKDATIVSRKPTISKVYTGRDFVGIPNILVTSVDSLLQIKNTDEHTCLIILEQKGESILKRSLLKYIVTFRSSFSINNQQIDEGMGVPLYLIPNNNMEQVLQILEEQQVAYTLDYERFMDHCKKQEASDLRIFDPDLMLNYLLENKIDYLLLAQLRMDPTQNTGLFINNIHLFVQHILSKHENRFQIIHTVGNEEFCQIVQFIH